MKQKKTWKEKLADSKDLPRIQEIPERLRKSWGTGRFVIPAPAEVDELMRQVPKRKLTTINHVRMALAKKHRANIACPLTTGIFAWIAANAAEEDSIENNKTRITPYWRTLKAGGLLNEKYPGGAAAQRKRLLAEGHKVTKKGNNYFVADLEQSLFEFK